MQNSKRSKVPPSKDAGPPAQPRKSIALSQNFINNKGIIATIIRLVDLAGSELVIEVGPGKGIITDALIKPYNRVIAVEKDQALFSALQQKYAGIKNISIVHDDFLKYPLPTESYIMVANIPFNITAKIIRKITGEGSFLKAAYLITEKEAAYKFVGAPYAESPLVAHFLHIHYEVKFLMQIDRSNFTPEPRVDIGFISIRKRRRPILEAKDEIQFKDFLTYIFSRVGGSMHEVYKSLFNDAKSKTIFSTLNIMNNAPKKKVLFFDWVKLYREFQEHASPRAKQLIKDAYEKLNKDKAKLDSHK